MEKLKGYAGIGLERGKFVHAEDACTHVLKECGAEITNPEAPLADEFLEEIVAWYFSGNWVEVYEEGDDA